MDTEICEKFVYKLSETIEHVKNEPTFKKSYKIQERITREFLRLRMRKYQGIAFIWTQIYREIFKSAVVFLKWRKSLL